MLAAGNVTELEEELSTCENKRRRLGDILRLFMVKVHGFVNTTGWEKWYSPTWAVSITFAAKGIQHICLITDRTYEIPLQNNHTYLVTVQHGNAIGQSGNANWEGRLELYHDQETLEKD